MAGENGIVNTVVALDFGVERDTVEAVLTDADDIQVVGIVEGLDEAWQVLQEHAPTCSSIACAGYSDRALVLIDARRRSSGRTGRSSCSRRARRTASSGGVFEVGRRRHPHAPADAGAGRGSRSRRSSPASRRGGAGAAHAAGAARSACSARRAAPARR